MKRPPKIKRKGYQTGTNFDGIQKVDENGNPIDEYGRPVTTANGNTGTYGTEFKTTGNYTPAMKEGMTSNVPDNATSGDKKQKGNITSKLGSSMGWMQFANQGKDFAKSQVDYETITDPTTGETYTKPKTFNGAVIDETATPYHEKYAKILKEGKNDQLGKELVIGALSPLGVAGGQIGYNAMFGRKEREKEWNDNINKIEANKEKQVNAGNVQDAIDARNSGEEGFTTTNKYRRDPSTVTQPVKNKNVFEKFGSNFNSFAKGGEIKGKGTPKSDSINAEVEEGSFVVPAENSEIAESLRAMFLNKKSGKAKLHQKKGVPVKLSDEEHLFDPKEKETLENKGVDLEALAPEAKDENTKATGGDVSEEEIVEDVPNKISSKKPPETKKTTTVINPATKTTVKAKSTTKKPKVFTGDFINSKPFENSVSLMDNMIKTDASKIENVASNKIDATPLTDTTAKQNTPTQKSNIWDSINNTVNNSGALDFALGATQTAMGLKNSKNNVRPEFKIDPLFLSNVDKAQQQAGYGFTAEQQALLDQTNNNLLNEGRAAARNYSGGSGGNAINLERQAINDSFMRKLQNSVANNELQMAKQQYATDLSAQKMNASRTIFEDSLRAFDQKSAAAAQLTQAGIKNILNANRFQQFMKMRNEEINNPYVNNGM
jgi:hypothetical protein